MSEHIEPLDARKTRALTLENMKLTREVERLRGHQVPLISSKSSLLSLEKRKALLSSFFGAFTAIYHLEREKLSIL